MATRIEKIVGGASVVAVMTVVALVANFGESTACNRAEVSMELQGQVVCLTEGQYEEAKLGLYNEYMDTGKDYDFHIDNRELLNQVLTREIAEQDFQLEGFSSKEELAEQLINLLKP